jgi:hypothetical protein
VYFLKILNVSIWLRKENYDWFEWSCQKNCRQEQLSTGNGVYAGEGMYSSTCSIFLILSTRVTEFSQLQLDGRFEIQIYDRAQKTRNVIGSSISNLRYWVIVLCDLQCGGSRALGFSQSCFRCHEVLGTKCTETENHLLERSGQTGKRPSGWYK